jgi:S1-C subfamily serine protease
MIRLITDTFRVCLITLLYITVASCSGACASTYPNKEPVVHNFPVKSFVQLRSDTFWKGCELGEDNKIKCQNATSRAVSSGSFIKHSEVDSSVSYALTAGHSCRSTFVKERKIEGVVVTHMGQKFTLIDYNGFKYEALVVATDKRFDLCLLRVNTVLIRHPVLKVAEKSPTRGEIAYNMAAPHGIFSPRMVLTFDGYFSGYSREGYALYTIPTKPGSSGSPIMNVNNELIGNIFAGYRSMENIGVASPLKAIKVFLRNSIAKAEMQVWQKMNNNEDKTDSIMIKMMQNLHKNLHKYFKIGGSKETDVNFEPL